MLARTVAVALLALLSAAVAKRRLQDGMSEEVLSAAKLFSHNEPKDAVSDFIDRVFSNLPATPTRQKGFNFKSWRHAGRPTKEGVGVMSIEVDVDKLSATIMNVSKYQGNIDYVEESHAISDLKCKPPGCARVYQRIKLPTLPPLQHEIVLKDFGMRDGWRVLAWQLLDDETERLDSGEAARADYNLGAWLLKPDAVAFAASSAPRKTDVDRLQYAVLTKGADTLAKKALKVSIKGMVALSRR